MNSAIDGAGAAGGPADLGVVVIGRNEGARLRRSLESVYDQGCPVIYVDSQSSDQSLATAAELGIPCLSLDPARPMNAARARNEGFAWLTARQPGLSLVQFVDGDTVIEAGWLADARRSLLASPSVGVVSGHLLEREPDRSIFHTLANLEWRKAPGPTPSTGGIFMTRVDAFRKVGGFDGNFPAGEEADLCMRVRNDGFFVVHLDRRMGTHDMGDIGFRSWWLRSVRTGTCYGQGARAGRYRREARSALAWGLALPALVLFAAVATHGWGLLLVLAVPVQMARVFQSARARGWTGAESKAYGVFTVLAKIPESVGLIRHRVDRWRGSAPRLIHYR